MPLGESVGRAYVRLFIDGEGIPEQIREALMDAEPDIETQGAKGSQAYQKGWDEGLARNKKLGVSLKDQLDAAIAEVDATQAFFKSPQWKRFEREVERRFPGIGEVAAKRMAEGFKARGTLSGIDRAIANIVPQVRDALEEIQKAEALEEAEAQRQRAAHQRETQRLLDRAYRQQERLQIEHLRNQQREEREAQREAQRALDRAYRMEEQRHKQHLADKKRAEDQFEREFRRTIQETDRLQRGIYRDQIADNERLARSFGGVRSAILSLGNTMRTDLTRQMKASARDAQTNTSIFTKLGKSLDNTADITGRAFGRGSRNNFLNFFGSVVRNTTGLLSIIPKLTGGIIEMARTFGSLFRAARASQGVLGALFTAARGAGLLAGAFTLLTSLLVALPVAITVVIVALSALATIISGVTAAITALAASLSFAVVGALAPLVAILPVIGAGFAVLALGVADLADRSKRLKEATQPLREEFGRLREIAGQDLFEAIVNNADHLRRSFRSLRPVVAAVSESFKDSVAIFAEAADSQPARRFLAYLQDIVPDAIRSLSLSLRNAFGGFAGVLIAMEPTLRRFLDWLERVTLEFFNWANSKEGRKEIRQFLRDAETSLKSVWGFIKSIGGLIGLLFGEGRASGDSIFKSMEESIRKFTKYLEENPEALNEWFRHGREIAKTLGEIIVLVGHITDALDSPAARGAFSWLRGELRDINREWKQIEELVKNVGDWGKEVGDSFINDFWKPLKKWAGEIGESFMKDFVEPILKWGKRVGEFFIKDFIEPIEKGVDWLAKKLGIELENIPEPFPDRKIPPGLQAITKGSIESATALERATRKSEGFKTSVGSIKHRLPVIAEFIDRQARQAIDKLVVPRKTDVTANPIVRMAEAALNHLARSRTVTIMTVLGAGFAAVKRALDSVTGFFNATINFGKTASGGVFSGPQVRMIGEAGPEAVVPLDRPLSQVDPAVRMLSAIAQGLPHPGVESVRPAGRSVDVGGLTIVTPTKDPFAVAHEVINELAAAGY